MRSNRRYKSARRRGTILAMVCIVMVVMSLMMIGYWQLSALDGLESGLNITSTKAFWAAEAGLHDALVRLNYSSVYQQNPTNFTGTVTGGVYAVSVTATTTTNYTIISTGTVGRSYRIVQQTTFITNGWPSAFNYALTGFSHSGSVGNNATINGNYYQNGPITFNNNSTDNGNVTANGSIMVNNNADVTGNTYSTNVSGNGSYTEAPPTNSQPALPALNTSYYAGQIAIAATNGASNPSYTTLNLAGGTKFVNGNVTINNNGSLTGTGILVATGSITLDNNVTVGNNITLIAGTTLTLNNNVNCSVDTLYAGTGVILSNNGGLLSECAILTPGNVTINNNFTYDGIIYAGGNFTMNNNATIEGSVVAGGTMTIANNTTITYDPSQFPASMPSGIQGATTIAKLRWHEQ